jgi:hypothetical protein
VYPGLDASFQDEGQKFEIFMGNPADFGRAGIGAGIGGLFE